MKPTRALHEAGQSLWLDNITRALFDKGILPRYVAGSVASLFVSRWDAAVAGRVLDELRNRLAFAASWQDLLARIGARREQLARTA